MMHMRNVSKFLLDQSPRQAWRFLARKLLFRKPLKTFDEEHPCVFVLSTGRTGTETIAALFTLSGNVISLHEPSPKLYEMSRLAYEYPAEPSTRTLLAASFRSLRSELLNTSLAYGLGYVESSPQVTFLAPAILEAFPMCLFIHLMRDPRDVVRSGMRRKWYAGHPGDATRIVPGPGSEHAKRWNEYSPFQKNLWLWAETNRWILEFTSGLSPERGLLVRSEDVFSGDEKTLHDLYQFIGSPLPHSRKISRLLGRKLNAQVAGDFPPAALWSAGQKNDLFNIAGGMAKRLGYELS